MVEKAKDFVKFCTDGDASGHDYFHTIRVLELASTIAREESRFHPVELETVQLIALLHDVVEDSNITLDDLREIGFPYSVVEAVDAITRRDGEDRIHYLNRVKENALARVVKIADLKHKKSGNTGRFRR